MDIIFGAITADDCAANIARQEQGAWCFISCSLFNRCNRVTRMTGISNIVAHAGSNDTDFIDNKDDGDR